MHFRFHRRGERWQAFAEHMRNQFADGGFPAGIERGPRMHRGRGGGRVLDGNALRLVLLGLIAEGPRHGYDLIKEIEAITGGAYAPSPGMIYPTLTLLADQGHVSEQPDGTRKLFVITDAGQAELAANAGPRAEAMARLEELARRAARSDAAPVRRALRNLESAIMGRLGSETADRDLQLAIAALLDDAAQRVERL